MIVLQWHRLDAPGGGWRAHHGLRWRCTVWRERARGWAYRVERTDADGAWVTLGGLVGLKRRADAQSWAANMLDRMQGHTATSDESAAAALGSS